MYTEQLWYSQLSTGIIEIDNQHSNIDILLTLFNKNNDDSIDMALEIVKALRAHFRYEESLIGLPFPKDHIVAHNDFIDFNEYQLSNLNEKIISKNQFVSIIRMKLLDHANLFDSHLKEYLQ